jgi:Tfp pilus assembly protein PilN
VIEVNLLPGGRKRSGGRGFSLTLPKFGGAGSMPDGYILFFVAAAIGGIAYMALTFLGVRAEHEELQVRLEEERQDSIRFAAIIEQTNRLTARGDSIAQRVAIIQEIDADRFVWAHLLDEIAAAVPDYTWLREVIYAAGDPLQVRINGRAGSIYAITNFMRRLEASRFLRAVTMESTQQGPSESNPSDLVYIFELLVTYEPPSMDEMETVPLFETETMSAQSAAPGVGGS